MMAVSYLLMVRLVVDNDGEHGSTEKSGEIWLDSGLHNITVTYFQSGGGKTLTVYYKGPQTKRNILPASILYFDQANE